jgi:methyl-accepting chemotaxis protein
MKVSTRLMILSLASLLVMAAVGIASLFHQRASAIEERRAQIFTMLRLSKTLVQHYQELERTGRLTRAQAQESVKEALTFLHNGRQAYYWVRSPEGLNLAHFNPKVVGTQSNGKAIDGSSDTQAYLQAMRGGNDGMGIAAISAQMPDGEMAPKLNGVYAVDAWGWWVGTGFFTRDIDESFWKQARLMLGVLSAAILGLAWLSWHFSRSIVRTLGGEPVVAARIAERISQGFIDEAVPVVPGDHDSLMFRIGQMQRNLTDMISMIRLGAESIHQGAEEISTGNTDLSSRTEEQASSLQQTAASMEQLTRAIEQNATHAAQGDRLAADAAHIAKEGRSVFERMAQNMEVVNTSSRRIGDIIGVIDGIAFQTNILALNAAVEAARAGEQGRGFAVVASEVRTLAQRSATAAREIKALIENSAQQVHAGTRLVDEAGGTLEKVLSAVNSVSSMMAEISKASAEQSVGVGQISEAITRMDVVTQGNAAAVEEVAAVAMGLRRQAENLRQAVSVFKAGDAAAVPKLAHSRDGARLQLA